MIANLETSVFATNLVVGSIAWLYYKGRAYDLRHKYSTFWPRFWTHNIDAAILWPAGAIAVLIGSFNKGIVLAIIAVIVRDIVCWSYSLVMQAKYGRTVGKMLCGVKIVDATTELPITFKQVFLRNIIQIILTLWFPILEIRSISRGEELKIGSILSNPGNPYAIYIIVSLFLAIVWAIADTATIFTNPKWRALHDYIAGTVVVRI